MLLHAHYERHIYIYRYIFFHPDDGAPQPQVVGMSVLFLPFLGGRGEGCAGIGSAGLDAQREGKAAA